MKEKAEIINEIRSFNRFYTNILGLIDKTILESAYSLTEARVLFEMYDLDYCTANSLSSKLLIDKSYMSRIIKKFERDGLIAKKSSNKDNRKSHLNLTTDGIRVIEDLIEKSNDQISKILEPLTVEEYKEMSLSMTTIKNKLTKGTSSINIREFTNDDLNFVIFNQIKLYELEYGFTTDEWKNYVKDGVKQLVNRFSSDKDCMYILENNSEPQGCIAITHIDDSTAQLRFFFIDSALRGVGAGNVLIDKALDFCKQHNYKKVCLWTFSTLYAARYLYSKKGFKITQTHENNEWGSPVLEECWELEV